MNHRIAKHASSLLLFCTIIVQSALAQSSHQNIALVELASHPVTIPMDFVLGKAAVALMINGQGPHSFILDTGAAQSVIDKALAEKLDLPVMRTGSLSSPGGEEFETEVVKADSILFGDALLTDAELTILDIPGAVGIRMAGVLSYRHFSNVLLTIDYASQTISFEPGELNVEGPNTIHYKYSDEIPEITVKINKKNYPLHLDIGSPGIITLPKDVADKLQFQSEPAFKGKATLVDRAVNIYEGKLKGEIQFAGLTLVNPIVGIIDLQFGQIGQGFFRDKALVIDQKNNLIRIR